MLRATSGRISQYTLQRNNIRPLSTDPLFLQFLYPSISRNLRWSRHSSIAAATQFTPADLPPKPDCAYPPYSIPIPDAVVGYNGEFLSLASTPAANPINKPSLIIVDTPRLRNSIRKKGQAIGGISNDKHEVLATFEACIRIGRIARGQLMLNMITTLLEPTSPLLLGAHNTFLKALLNRALAEQSQDSLRVFFTWYEDTMKRELRLTGDATTIALLLEGSFAVEDTGQGQRYIRQYVDLWKDQGRDIKDVFGLQVLSVEQVIAVTRVCGLDPNELDEEHKALYLKEEPVTVPSITKVPEVTSSSIKGTSLNAIKQSLATLIEPDSMPSRSVFGQNDAAFQIERQRLLEKDALQSAQDRWKKDYEALAAQGVTPLRNNMNSLLWSWHQSLVPLIKQELERVREAEENPTYQNAIDRCLYGPFLRLMAPEKVAAVVVLEMIRMQNFQPHGEGTKSSSAVMAVSKIVEQEYYAQELANRGNREIFGTMEKEELAEIFNSMALFRSKISKARKMMVERPQVTSHLMLEWPATVRAKLGAVLISMLLHCAKVPVTKRLPGREKVVQHHPAIQHAYEYVKGRKLGVLKLHQDIIKKLSSEPLRGSALGRNLPMLVPPLPWLSWNDGGYYYSLSQVVRTKSCKEQEIYVQAASRRGDLDQIFKGLDILGQTAWKINARVFDIVLKVWNKGEEFADIPPRDFGHEMPQEPEPSDDPKVRSSWIKEVRRLKLMEKNNHSQRCAINLKLEIARAFLFEKFYFPHNIDFRGRAYPIPPNLNHIGDDLSRGLLMFANAKELGENGLRWLKIHCANLAGYDKASFADRVKFVDDNIEDVFDSADNPLEGRRWWLKAEDPWQCFATCVSITEALRSPDPKKYMCHTTVAQDGTCNGLQHYAALGGDEEGAKQVNLEPSDKPQDVYTGVAELVKEQVQKDAIGDELDGPIARLVHGHITRKVVKQSVMTNVYGVTFVGARNQIQRQLEDNPLIPRAQVGACASYIARLVFASIREVFSGASKIQHWLALSARMISRSVSPVQYASLKDHHTGILQRSGSNIRRQGKVEFMTSVVWTTPLKMAVVQPYRHENGLIVQTNLQKIYISDPSSIDQVNSRKQMTAFPPNFIHSLDASHMLLSALKCAKEGLSFASVHDSFWTHPSDVDALNGILRDAFVELHSVNIMEKLKEEFETRYKGYKYLVSIPGTSAAAKLVKSIRKKYATTKLKKQGLTMVDDLEWEIKRDHLISSDDPEEKALGQAMTTPSVIVNEAGGSIAIQAEEPLGAELGGEISKPKSSGGTDELEDVFEDPNNELEDGLVVDGPEEGDDEPMMDDEPAEEIELDDEPAMKANPLFEKKKYPTLVHVWMPLTFPPLPPKGSFDVQRLKESKYFFS